MFLDTDDILATFCLQQRVKIAQENVHCDFVIFPMLVFYQKPDDLKILWNIDNETDDVTRILTGDPICQGTGTLWRKQSFINIGLWDENLLLWQDIELHLRSMLGGMRFVKRMDLEPDVFIRISDVSLSRTGYHSLPKWKSRLKVLTDTTVTILEKNLLPKYRDGLRHMFTDLFMNAAGSNFFQEARSLLKQEENWNILKPSERSILKRYLVMRRARLYKLPFIEKSFRKNLRSLHTPLTATINRVTYHKKIQL